MWKAPLNSSLFSSLEYRHRHIFFDYWAASIYSCITATTALLLRIPRESPRQIVRTRLTGCLFHSSWSGFPAHRGVIQRSNTQHATNNEQEGRKVTALYAASACTHSTCDTSMINAFSNPRLNPSPSVRCPSNWRDQNPHRGMALPSYSPRHAETRKTKIPQAIRSRAATAKVEVFGLL